MQDSRSPLTELQVAVIPNLIQIDELDEPAGCHPQRCLGLRSGSISTQRQAATARFDLTRRNSPISNIEHEESGSFSI